MTDDDDLFSSPGPRIKLDPDGIPRDHLGRYYLPDITGQSVGPVAYQRATTFAKVLEDTYMLDKWRARMVVKGLTLRPDLYALAAGTKVDNRAKLNEIAEKAAEAAGATVRAGLGTAFHTFTEQYDRGEDVTVPAIMRPELDAYVSTMNRAGLKVIETERVVVIPEYGVAGTLDRIVETTRPLAVDDKLIPAGTLLILDVKSGNDLEFGMHAIAIQLALYAHAVGMWRKGTEKYDRMPSVSQHIALVIHVPIRPDEQTPATAELLTVDIAAGWGACGIVTVAKDWRRRKNLSVPVNLDRVVDPITVEFTAPEDGPVTPRTEWPDPSTATVGWSEPDGPNDNSDPSMALPSGPSTVVPCGAHDDVMDVVCAAQGPHLTHKSASGVRWPVTDLADGVNCISCSRPAKGGKITHVKGCPEVVRRRVPKETEQPDDRTLPVMMPLDQRTATRRPQNDEPVLADTGTTTDTAGSLPPVDEAVDPFAELYETPAEQLMNAVKAANSSGELSLLRKEGIEKGIWTDEHLAAGMARMRDLPTSAR